MALLAGTSVLLARIEHTAALRARETAATTRALADARRALIGWSVGAGLSGSGVGHTPGILPFPDRNTDARGYDGRADCVTSWLSDRHLIGRFASAGETSPCPARVLGVEFRDRSGELLWYAVSRNLVNHRGGSSPDAPINPGLLDETPAYPWLRLVDANGVVVNGSDGEPLEIAAVIIAPGPPLADQARTGAAPGAGEYLDSVTVNGVTYDNADSDGCRDAVTGASAYTDCPGLTGEEFILYPDARDTAAGTDSFNDRIVYITAEELLRAAEARALGEMAVVLERYRSSHGVYPWMAPYTTDPGADPASTVAFHASVDGAGNTRRGMLPIHAAAGQLYDTHYTLSWTIDSGATIATTDPVSVGSTPAPSDAELYALASATPQTTTAPATCAWNGDDGVQCAGEPYLHDPGTSLTWNGPILQEREVFVSHAETTWTHTTGTGSAGANPGASSPRTPHRGHDHEPAGLLHRVGARAQLRVHLRRRRLLRHRDHRDVRRAHPQRGHGHPRDVHVHRPGIRPERRAGRRPALVRGQRMASLRLRGGVERRGGSGRPPPGRCTGSGTNCLTVNTSGGTRIDVPAFLIGAGPALPDQTRAGCGSTCLGEYFELPDNAAGDDSATRAALTVNFNDQIRVVGPQGISP